nr:hypothetical protein [Tanacetum cinerariifolium]
MAPKKTTRANPATTTTTTTTSVTDAQLEALIELGVAKALEARNADRNTNSDDNHNLRTGARRTKRVTRECTYPDFMKCKPLNFKGTEGVVGLKIDKVEKYVDGLPDTIHGSQPNKRQNTGRAYAVGNGERKEYAGTLQLCNKYKFYHNGQCTIKCANCKRVGHLTQDCRSPAGTNNHRNLTCYECRNQGHYRSDCPELKNQDHGNQPGGTGAHGMVHALEGGETNQDLNDVDDDIIA